MSVFEICDDNGKVIARTRVFPVAKSECDKLSREWNQPLKVVEVATVKSTRTVYEAK